MDKPKTTKERQTARREKLKKDDAGYKAYYLQKDWSKKVEQRKNQRQKMNMKKHEEYKIKERTRIRNFCKKKQQHHQKLALASSR